MAAFIVLKQTPRGMKLMPLSAIQGTMGQGLLKSHPQHDAVAHLMEVLMLKAKPLMQRGQRPSLKELWDLVCQQYGPDFFEATYSAATDRTVARLTVR